MNTRELVLRLLKIAEKYNLDQNDIPALLIKTIVLSLKYVNRKQLFEALYPSQYADWELVDLSLSNSNALGDTEPWLSLLDLFEWPSLSDKEINQTKPALAQIKALLKTNGLDQPGWTVACRVLVLQLIQNLQSMHAIELMTSRILQRNTKTNTMQFLAALYDQKHLPSTYFDLLFYLFSVGNVQIQAAGIVQTIAILAAQKEEYKMSVKLKSIQQINLRPRLRDRLKVSLLTDQNKIKVDGELGTWDSYTGFCHTHRFPNNLSDRVKRQLYFLASQTTWDWHPFINRFIQHIDLQDKIQQHPVTHPDLEVIISVIEGLSMDGRPPFSEMMQFKAKCFGSFPIVWVQKLTLTQILRLYIAAYQNIAIWREVWKSLIGMMSPQISRDCEKFASETPFACAWVIEALSGIPSSIASITPTPQQFITFYSSSPNKDSSTEAIGSSELNLASNASPSSSSSSKANPGSTAAQSI